MGMFVMWQSKDDNEPKTMNWIAKSIGMVPSQHVTDMLLELCEEGKLGFVKRQKFGRWEARAYYSTVKTLITEKYGNRRVNVKRKGEVIGSLEVPAGQMGLWS